MANILQQVITYQKSALAYLDNYMVFAKTANTKFKNFQDFIGNLGDTVEFDLPYRFVSTSGLVVGTAQDIEQRKDTLTVDKALNVFYAVTNQERIFNLSEDEYMNQIGKGAITELAVKVEADIANVAIDNTYRFYGDGVTSPNTYGELAKALTNFRNLGMADDTKFYLPDTVVNEIIDSGLNQFKLDRNREDFNSWEIGSFNRCNFYSSNLLPLHTAGTAGQSASTITVDSISLDGTSLTVTVTGLTSDPDAFKDGDIIYFDANSPNPRFLTNYGHEVSAQTVSCRVESDSGTDGADQAVLSIFPALIDIQSNPTDKNANIDIPIVASQTMKALPNHRAGLITQGNALYVGMPRLPDEDPFATANQSSPDTGISCRLYYGSKFGENQKGVVHDVVWGKKLVDECSLRFVLPENY